MATMYKRTNHWAIQFKDPNHRCRTITLGFSKYTAKVAMDLKEVVEKLLFKKLTSDPTLDKRTLTWIETASPDIRKKLAKVGLFEEVLPPKQYTCKELWDAFIQERKKRVEEGTLEEATLKADLTIRRRFLKFFDSRTTLSELNKERMLEWRAALPKLSETRKQNSEATVTGTIIKAMTVFNWAVEQKWIKESPLKDVPRGSYRNPDNDRNITIDEYHRLLDACRCYDWKVIFALARIGGLRAPSEVRCLRWSDVKWDEGVLIVTSPKTKRYKGKDKRCVPLFPALREILENYPDCDKTDSEFVVDCNRVPKTSFGTQFGRIAKAAGLGKIPRPFDNMRASRSNEIYAAHGPFYESKWIGHSQKVAFDCYLQIRPEDIQRAIDDQTGIRKPEEKPDTENRKDDQDDNECPPIL